MLNKLRLLNNIKQLKTIERCYRLSISFQIHHPMRSIFFITNQSIFVPNIMPSIINLSIPLIVVILIYPKEKINYFLELYLLLVMNTKKVQSLSLTYEQYKKLGKSIANSSIDKYVIYDEIGRGSFGAVYKGMNDQTKSPVAVKVLDLQAVQLDPSQRVKQIRRRLCKTESQLMMLCSSDNIVRCFDVYENKSLKIMVIEFCNGGTLQTEIDVKKRIPEKEAILILKQVINGIAQMHQHRIIHRDLKAENILSHNGIYKIADLGFSKQIDPFNEMKQTTLGTITTMAPEVMKKEAYGLKADIWSIGIIFFQMIFGKVPYISTTANQMYQEIKSKKILNTENFTFNNYTASKEVTNFLREILVIESDKRLGWRDLIHHPLFKEAGGKLDNQFRINFKLSQDSLNLQNIQKELIKPDMIIKFDPSSLAVPNGDAQEFIRLTQLQANLKKKEIINRDDALYEWVKSTHLQCLKTELIFQNIIEVIEHKGLIDFENRNSIEFMYLLITRCLNNISVINDKLVKEKNAYVIKNLQETVNNLYQKIQVTWGKYSNKLTEMESKMGSIISDRFLKIFKSESIKEKDRYLVGIETSEYTKQQQIEFTERQYISQLKGEIKSFDPDSKKMKEYLIHYREINEITLRDLNNRSFQEYVGIIIQ